MRKKRTKIIIFVILILCGLGIFWFFDSLYGNPISASIATNKIKKYVETNYPEINVQIEPVHYSFKNGGSYFALVKSLDSIDTKFYISVRNRGGIEDEYQSVANLSTTLNRLNDELDNKVKLIIDEQFPYETRLIGCYFVNVKNLKLENYLARDMALDIENPPLPIELIVWCSADHPDYEVLAERMVGLQYIMDENKIPVAYYSVSIEHPYVKENNILHPLQYDSISVEDFPADRLNENNLSTVLENYIKEYEKEHEKN